MQKSKSIVVGYDGSDQAAQAVRWAAEQAVLRNCPLHLVHCTLWPLLTHRLGPVPGIADSGLERSAEIILEEGLAHVKREAPGAEVRTSLLQGQPTVHLPAISAGQEMLVVGSRGLGGFLGLLVGSVSLEMTATAPSPVAVIRSGGHPEGPVVAAIVDPWSGLLARGTLRLYPLNGKSMAGVTNVARHWTQRNPNHKEHP